jgi:hypothetical protein
MLSKIFLNKNLPLKRRIKNIISYFLIRRGARLAWKNMFRQFYASAPENFKSTSKEEEKVHVQYWSYFSKRVNLNTYRVCKNLSGVGNPKYIPEEIYIADIEKTLNRDIRIDYLSNKSFYSHWFPEGIFPVDYFHNIEGEYLNKKLETISYDQVREIASGLVYPVVIKPNQDSYGGRGVAFPVSQDELLHLVAKNKNFVVEEKIQQHEFFDKYNRHGLNTVRVSLYRSVKDNRLHIINTAMRMGIGGGLDNLSSGGILTYIRKDGTMNGFAVNKFGFRYFEHPDTHLKFNEKIPDLELLRNLCKRVAHKIFYARILSLDACYDMDGKWRIVEANVLGQHTIKFAQNAGQPFFREFTDEVVEYCKVNHWALK